MNAAYQIFKGTDLVLTLWARDVNSNPVDLTGSTIGLALPLVGGTTVTLVGTIVDALTGEFTVPILNTTDLLPALNIPMVVQLDYSGVKKEYEIPDGLSVLEKPY